MSYTWNMPTKLPWGAYRLKESHVRLTVRLFPSVTASFMALCFAAVTMVTCANSSSTNRFGDDFYKSVEVADKEISSRRLDLAWEALLAKLPPLESHGQLYGSCPLYSVEGTPLGVFCLGFWGDTPVPWETLSDKTYRTIEIVYVGRARCEATTFCIRWADDAVTFEGYFNGRDWTQPPDAETMDYCRRLTLAVLDRCTDKEWRNDSHIVDKQKTMRNYLDKLHRHAK